MTTSNGNNMFDSHINKLKERFGFKQVFLLNGQAFGNSPSIFEALKQDGTTTEIRYIPSDDTYEELISSRWTKLDI
jgi:hypothetical protein